VTGKLRGATVPLTNSWVGMNRSSALSPDGKRVAYLSSRHPARYGPGAQALVVKSLDMDMEKEFSTSLQIVGNPIWFADGRRLLIVSREPQGSFDVHTVDPESGRFSLITHLQQGIFPVGIALSADGETVYTPVALNGGTIDALTLSTGQRKTVYRPDSANGAVLSLSPDGRTLAVLMSAMSGGKQTSKIVLVATDGTAERKLFEDEHPSDLKPTYGVAWSPDGRSVFFSRAGKNNESELWRMPVEGGSAEATGAHAPMLRFMSIGPKGELVFTGGVPEKLELWALDNLLPMLKSR
jgi:Tol biopolymer transport system component